LVRDQVTAKTSSYQQILKSSAVIGGASALTILFGLVRNKALALMLGPSGFGVMGLYLAIVDVAKSLAGMGVNQSGVRQIAESAASDSQGRAAVTAYVLRRTSLILGILGAAVLLILAKQVSQLSFGTEAQTVPIRILSAAILFGLVAEGQGALLQGLRRIGDLARIRIYGGLYSTLATIAIVYALGERGIVAGVVAGTVVGVLAAAWYVRRLGLKTPAVSRQAVSKEAAELLKLGFAFMGSAFLMMGAAYAVRAIVSNQVGLPAAGLYQAAWTLGGLYTGFILQAMGTDFYPRLVGVIGDLKERNRLTNEQMTVSLMLAGPGILGTLALAPIALAVLYSGEFHEAAATLRWICLGMALRVVTWPPGFIIVSKNERWVFIGTEVIWAAANVSLTLGLVEKIGLEGAGMAFAASYVLHGIIVYTIVHKMYGFTLERSTLWAAGLFLIAITAVLLGFSLLSEPIAILIGIMVTLASSVASTRALVTMIPAERLPRLIAQGLRAMRLLKDSNR
jgi:enterobacterial common antigen flippase